MFICCNFDTAKIWELIPVWLTAIGTVSAVIFAIYKDWFLRVFVPPILSASLVDITKEKIIRGNWDSGELYFHIKVSNLRQFSPALQVNAFINKIEQKVDNDDSIPYYLLDKFPIYRAYSKKNDAYFKTEPTIGFTAYFDILKLEKKSDRHNSVDISLKIPHRVETENGHNKITLEANISYDIEVLIFGINSRNESINLQVKWFGSFPKEDKDIPYCISVSEVPKNPDSITNCIHKLLKKLSPPNSFIKKY